MRQDIETDKQRGTRGGLSFLLLLLAVIGCQPPQSDPSLGTADSVAPGAAPAVTVGAAPQQGKGFLEWCRDAAAPAEVRYTVTVLIAYLETDDCVTADRSLATEDRLDLENYAVTREFGLDEYPPPPPTFAQMIAERPVRDLRPISGMTNLQVLNLDGNQIDDLLALSKDW